MSSDSEGDSTGDATGESSSGAAVLAGASSCIPRDREWPGTLEYVGTSVGLWAGADELVAPLCASASAWAVWDERAVLGAEDGHTVASASVECGELIGSAARPCAAGEVAGSLGVALLTPRGEAVLDE